MESTVGSDTEGKKRRRFSAVEKASIIREHLQGKVPISDLSDRNGVQPSVIYGWMKVAVVSRARLKFTTPFFSV